jgi:hypothetical protein
LQSTFATKNVTVNSNDDTHTEHRVPDVIHPARLVFSLRVHRKVIPDRRFPEDFSFPVMPSTFQYIPAAENHSLLKMLINDATILLRRLGAVEPCQNAIPNIAI